jgi:zinc protease
MLPTGIPLFNYSLSTAMAWLKDVRLTQWPGLFAKHFFAKKRIGLLVLLTGLAFGLVLATGWMNPANALTAQHYDELTFPPLADVRIRPYERYELDNGLVVYLMEDHELPLVGGSLTLRTGDYLDPEGKVGLGNITGSVMRSGGTTRYDADALNTLLEQRAASVETSIGTTAGSASFSSLTEDLSEVFDVFSDVLRNPAFAEDKVSLLKNQYRGSISRRNDDPDEIASREFNKLIYGAQSPYARTVEYADLDNISRQDLLDFYQSYVTPQGAILGIVGDFEPEAMKALIQAKLGNWQPSRQAKRAGALPGATQQKRGIFTVDQPQLTQSYILLGHLGGQLSNPDHAPLTILNEVLNGFGGRLFNNIRSRQGLAYVVYAYWNPEFDHPGTLIGGGQTRSEATVPLIRSMVQEIKRMQQEPISEQELQFGKDSVLNGFVFNFQTADQTLSRLIRYEYYGYPSDFIFQFKKKVEDATVEQVLKAAQTNLKPDDLAILVVGNMGAISPPLTDLNSEQPITPIDITIAGAPAAS